jgi:hypothetical protein
MGLEPDPGDQRYCGRDLEETEDGDRAAGNADRLNLLHGRVKS